MFSFVVFSRLFFIATSRKPCMDGFLPKNISSCWIRVNQFISAEPFTFCCSPRKYWTARSVKRFELFLLPCIDNNVECNIKLFFTTTLEQFCMSCSIDFVQTIMPSDCVTPVRVMSVDTASLGGQFDTRWRHESRGGNETRYIGLTAALEIAIAHPYYT